MVANTSSGPGDGRPSTPRSVRSKAGLREIEEGIVAVCCLGDQQLRRLAAFAAGQARREHGLAIGIGGGFAEDFVVDRDEAHLGAGDRLRIGQAAHEGMHAVIAGNGGEAEIGDDEPLRGDIVPIFVACSPLTLAVDHIGAGRHIAERFGHRNGRGGQRIGVALGQIDLALTTPLRQRDRQCPRPNIR